jgi:hypothetical protein
MSITFNVDVPDANSPEINVANMNAALMFSALGIAPKSYGNIDPNDVATWRRAILGALNRDLTPYTREAVHEDRYIGHGLDVEGIRDRLRRLDAVLAYAQSIGAGVAWS